MIAYAADTSAMRGRVPSLMTRSISSSGISNLPPTFELSISPSYAFRLHVHLEILDSSSAPFGLTYFLAAAVFAKFHLRCMRFSVCFLAMTLKERSLKIIASIYSELHSMNYLET